MSVTEMLHVMDRWGHDWGTQVDMLKREESSELHVYLPEKLKDFLNFLVTNEMYANRQVIIRRALAQYLKEHVPHLVKKYDDKSYNQQRQFI